MAKVEQEKIQRISRNLHDKLRRKAIIFERTQNDHYILMVPCEGVKGWYEMGDESALLYKYEVCDKIGVHAELKDDFDTFYNQYKIGRVRTRHPDTVIEHVKRAGLYAVDIEREHCIFVELSEKYTKEQIDQLKEEEKARQTSLTDIVETKVLDPALKVMMTDVAARLHRLCLQKMDKVARDSNGIRITERCDKALMAYYYIALRTEASDEDLLEMWRRLREHVFAIEVELQIIVDLKLWKRIQVVALGETVVEIGKRADKHIAKLEEKINKKRRKSETSRSKRDSKGDESAGAKAVAAAGADGSL